MSKKLLVLVLVTGLLAAVILYLVLIPTTSSLRVHILDVGQADCILVQTPGGKSLLIDAGNNSDWPVIEGFLKSHKVHRLDIVIGTHPHEDHIGSLDKVINNYDVGQLYMPMISTNTNTFRDVLLAAEERKLKINTARSNTSLDLDPRVQAVILAPIKENYSDLNDYSAVLKLTYEENTFLFMGDAGILVETELLTEDAKQLDADVLKVGHHGSQTATSEAFLEAVTPSLAIISVGKGNHYNHPHNETLSRLFDAGTPVLRTDLDGTILIVSDGKTIKLNKALSVDTPQMPKGRGVAL
jgi:competence protein ComEC